MRLCRKLADKNVLREKPEDIGSGELWNVPAVLALDAQQREAERRELEIGGAVRVVYVRRAEDELRAAVIRAGDHGVVAAAVDGDKERLFAVFRLDIALEGENVAVRVDAAQLAVL